MLKNKYFSNVFCTVTLKTMKFPPEYALLPKNVGVENLVGKINVHFPA